LDAIHLETGEVKNFDAVSCRFGYRDSVFKHEEKNQWMIISVTLRLSRNPKLNTSYGAIETELSAMGAQKSIQTISQAVINIRRSKLPDPAVIGNAGSFFKNPTVSQQQYEALKNNFPGIVAYPTSSGSMKLAAGWLIEQCGWKGKQVGQTGMHQKQALVLVNYGNANAQELYQHALRVQQSVKEKFGVAMEMEVNII